MHKLIKLMLVASLLLTSTLSFGETKDLPQQVLFSNVNIFDGRSDKLQQNMHVLVSGNKISEISAEPLAVIQSTNMTVIDGKGKTLMPGLIDGHVHLTHGVKGGLPGFENSHWQYIGAVSA